MSQKKLRWGILSTAKIGLHSVIPGMMQSETGEVAAICSRGEEKAKEAAERLNIPTYYGSYEALLEDESIDAVYIPLPNHLHKEWTIRAAQAGKHILCEKPIALNAQEAEEMVEVCRQAGVQLAEAFMYRHHPRYARLREIIDSGEIGDIRGIHGAFTFNNAGDKENVRYKQFMGGGSIYDVGCYPISAARFVLGREPLAATVHAFFSAEHDHVDMMAAGLLEFGDGVALTFDCGMWAAGRNTLEIVGSEGRIHFPSAFMGPMDESVNFEVYVGGEKRVEDVPKVNQYAVQVDHFAQSIFTNRPATFSAEDAIANMRVIDACLESARAGKRVIL